MSLNLRIYIPNVNFSKRTVATVVQDEQCKIQALSDSRKTWIMEENRLMPQDNFVCLWFQHI